jgi:hypothetical protein
VLGSPASVAIGGIITILATVVAARMVPSLARYDSSTWSDEPDTPTPQPIRASDSNSLS